MRCIPDPDDDSQPTSVRSYFDHTKCHVHGHPSSGGILIKQSADIVDLQFLSLSRFAASERSMDAEEEDKFCELMRRIGGTWWEDEARFLRGLYGGDEYDELDRDKEVNPVREAVNEARARKIVTFGWPADGLGVWVLRYDYHKWYSKKPADYGKMNFAISMEEKIEIMKEFGAEFVEDLSQVKELQEPWSPDVVDYWTTDEILAAVMSPTSSSVVSSESEYYEGEVSGLRCAHSRLPN